MEDELKILLKELIRETTGRLDRTAYEQEPNYTAALFGSLHGRTLLSPTGQYIKIHAAPSNDRGPAASERITGIDIGLVVVWEDNYGNKAEKAVLIQAKNRLERIIGSGVEATRLASQCHRMLGVSSSAVVMDCPYDLSVPNVYEAVGAPPGWTPPPMPLDTYLVDRVLECKDGDFEEEVVRIAKRADRSVTVTTNAPRPTARPRAKQGGPKKKF